MRLILITFLLAPAILMFAAPAPAFAQERRPVPEGETTYEQSYVPCGTEDKLTQKIQGGQIVSSSAGPDGVIDFASQCGFTHIIEITKRIIMGYIIAGVTFATIAFTYAGFLYITAMGSEEKISHAHSIFIKTVWAFVFLLGSWLIAYTLETVFLTEEFREEHSFLEQKKP